MGRRRRRRRSTSRPDRRREREDADGHIVFRLGSNLTDRFKILKFMGEGTFAKVLECWDRREKRRVAVKVIRAVSKYTEAAEIEIDILEDIRRRDPQGKQYCVIHSRAPPFFFLALKTWHTDVFFHLCSKCINFLGSFKYRNHICIVFPLYGKSLYDFIKRNRYRGFRMEHLREIAFNLIKSIAFIHSFDLIHTDLKPENILLTDPGFDVIDLPDEMRTPDRSSAARSRESSHATSASASSVVDPSTYMVPRSTDIRTIDFGSATYEKDHHSSIISTRHYRAPEVILGLGWSFPADMWSVGCILVELLTGDAMFQTHENREHLAMMEKILGKLPKSMTSRAHSRDARKYFTGQDHELDWPRIASSRSSVEFVDKLKPLHELCSLREPPDHPKGSSSSSSSSSRSNGLSDADSAADDIKSREDFYDLCRKLLTYEPHRRLTADEALEHPFFDPLKTSDRREVSIPASLSRSRSRSRSRSGR